MDLSTLSNEQLLALHKGVSGGNVPPAAPVDDGDAPFVGHDAQGRLMIGFTKKEVANKPLQAMTDEELIAAHQAITKPSQQDFSTAFAPGDAATNPGLSQALQDRIPSPVGSAIRGGAQGLSFGLSDELAGAAAAIPAIFGGDPVEAYTSARDAARKSLELDRTVNPGSSIAGEIGGSLLTAPLTGGMGVAARGAGLGARMLAGGRAGAITGGAYGFGTAEGSPIERIPGAAVGAATGAVAGGGLPVAGAALGVGRRAAGNLAMPFRDAINRDRGAGRRIAGALARDNVDPAQAATTLAAARAAGAPAIVADAGGETVRDLARSAANTSPEGRQALQNATEGRYQNQGERFTDFVRRLVGRTNAPQTRLDLEDAAQRANRPAYARAYAAPAARAIWSPELAQLTVSPDMQRAIFAATRRGANDAAVTGFRPPTNPFQRNPDGTLGLRAGAVPTLQFWDHVQRNLRNMIDKAQRAGGNEDVRDATRLRVELNRLLDAAVPEFARARAGAAAFFGAQDALEAGANFVTSKASNAEARRAIAAMSQAERTLFREGFASELISRIREVANRRDIVNSTFVNSPAARERISLALGQQEAAAVHAFLQAENVMNLVRQAVNGNSTTARQLIQAGLAGGGYAAFTGDFSPQSILTGAVVAHGARRGLQRVDQRVAQRVAEMLSSDDPNVLLQAGQTIARSPALTAAVRSIEDGLTRSLGPIDVRGGQAALSAAAGDNQPEAPRPGQ